MPKLYLLIFKLEHPLVHEDYGNLRMRLQTARARPLFDSVYALREIQSAAELKEHFRKALGKLDGVLVIEVAGEWASRRALNNLAEL